MEGPDLRRSASASSVVRLKAARVEYAHAATQASECDAVGDLLSQGWVTVRNYSRRLFTLLESSRCVAANMGGDKLILPAGDYPELGSRGWNDRTSSYIVYQPSPGFSCEDSVAYFYNNGGQSGRSYPAPHGMTFSGVGDFNDKASSYSVPASVCVIAYKSGGFTGSSMKLYYGGTNTISNDVMSSFTVWPYNATQCTTP